MLKALIFSGTVLMMSVLSPLGGAQQKKVDAAGHEWYHHAVFYEIYPRSFADSNGDGIGDLKGITSKLDYLEHLGVDAIWITPCFPSPQVDFGYDVSDYEAIDPMYGTLADFDELVADGQRRITSRSFSISCRITLRISTNGFWNRNRRRRIQSATGTSGATARTGTSHRTIGLRRLVDRRGRSIRRRDSITTIISTRSSPT